MTRNEEIRQEALKWKTDDNEFIAQTAFEAGALWADEHPKSARISCKDRLPKEFEFVLLHLAGDDSNLYVTGALFNYVWRTITLKRVSLEGVDYWMPIPDVPKGGEQ